jgi:hypothetical protein
MFRVHVLHKHVLTSLLQPRCLTSSTEIAQSAGRRVCLCQAICVHIRCCEGMRQGTFPTNSIPLTGTTDPCCRHTHSSLWSRTCWTLVSTIALGVMTTRTNVLYVWLQATLLREAGFQSSSLDRVRAARGTETTRDQGTEETRKTTRAQPVIRAGDLQHSWLFTLPRLLVWCLYLTEIQSMW